MSNDVSVVNDQVSLAEKMGLTKSEGSSSGPSTSRLTQIQVPLKSMVDVNGKKMNMEVLPVGTFALRMSEDETVYSDTVTVRMFLQREQWTRWYSDTNTMGKTVLANNLRNDMPDNMGGFNLGRPSGYVQDFNALPESTKDLMRAVKRTRVFMGLATLDNPMNDKGEDLGKEYKDIPFIYDVKNASSIKSIDAALKSFERRNTLPITGTMVFGSDTATLPNGNLFAYLDASTTSDVVEVGERDYETLDGFDDIVKSINVKVMDAHYDKRDKGLSDEEADIVGSIVDVEV